MTEHEASYWYRKPRLASLSLASVILVPHASLTMTEYRMPRLL